MTGGSELAVGAQRGLRGEGGLLSGAVGSGRAEEGGERARGTRPGLGKKEGAAGSGGRPWGASFPGESRGLSRRQAVAAAAAAPHGLLPGAPAMTGRGRTGARAGQQERLWPR